MENFKIFLVGGAVRDHLLGLPAKDKDYVVVGATPSDMIAMGYQQVGADFPVFLHPVTKDEYALARIEKKEGHGYNGFTCETAGVTLEDDLRRRDLTINSIAMDNEGNLIDPFGGEDDLMLGVLRHTSDAFAEDPVRVLRVARFAARYDRFVIATETFMLMETMAECGDLDHLTPERVWAETAKALTEKAPHKFFHILVDCGALDVVMPELRDTCCTFDGNDLTTNFVKFIDHQRMTRSTLDAFCQRLRVPNDLRDLARIGVVVDDFIRDDMTLFELFHDTDAFRRPAVFKAGLKPIVGSRLFNIVSEKLDRCLAINVASLGIDPKLMGGKRIGITIAAARADSIKGDTIRTIL